MKSDESVSLGKNGILQMDAPKVEIWPAYLDALVAAPEHHTLLFENEAVRILDTRIPAGGKTAIHTHRWPAALYILSWSQFIRRAADGVITVDTQNIPALAIPPRALWSEALGPHSLENVGTTDLHVISVELKQPGSLPQRGTPKA